MYLNNFQHLKNKESTIIILLILFSVLIRIPAILMFGDTSLENEWKVLVENLMSHGTLSFRNLDGYLLPNLYMPPLYAYYLYFFSVFNFENQNYIQLILSTQILLSSVAVALLYEINKLFFSQKISFYSSLLFSLFPLNIYSCTQISSVTLQTFFFNFVLLFFFSTYKKKKYFFYYLIFIYSRFVNSSQRRVYCNYIFESCIFIFIF